MRCSVGLDTGRVLMPHVDDEKFTKATFATFDEADVDGSHTLEASELAAIMSTVVMKTVPERFPLAVEDLPEYTEEEVLWILHEHDADGNGTLCRDEFLDFTKSLFAFLLLNEKAHDVFEKLRDSA